MHGLRHFYASALLDAGDPAMTLRVYGHLMPDSRGRARRAIETVFQRMAQEGHGPV